jgi:hypothetical protein
MSLLTSVETLKSVAKRRPSFAISTYQNITGNVAIYGDFWQVGWPTAGNVPPTSPGETCDSTKAGAFLLPPVPGGTERYITKISSNGGPQSGGSGDPTTLLIYDRLVHVSGISGAVTGAQSITTAPLPRYTDGVDVMIMVANSNFNTIMGSNNTISCSYTNENGVSGQISGAASAFQMAGGLFFDAFIIGLSNGDHGVRSVESVTFSTPAASGTGTIILALIKPIVWANLSPTKDPIHGFDWTRNWELLALPKIHPNACVSFMAKAYSMTSGDMPRMHMWTVDA